jgi:imidazolonepropionase-like amidohydrolase
MSCIDRVILRMLFYSKRKGMKKIAISFILLLAAVGAASLDLGHGQESATNTSVISHVAVVDVEKGCICTDQTVVITGERIVEVATQPEISVPRGAKLIDGKGMYLMPGLVDSHVHYFDPSTFGPLMVANGVLLVRDMGSPNLLAIGLRKKLNDGKLLGPEMITTGSMLDGDPPYIPSIAFGCKTPGEGRDKVRLQAKVGVDQIKLYSRLENDVFMAIVDEAQIHGLKAVGHVPETVYVVDAARAGQKSCEHMFGLGKIIAKLLGEPVVLKSGGMGTDVPYFSRLAEVDREKLHDVLRQIRDYGMAVCPTIVVMKHGAHLDEIMTGDYPNLEYVSPMIRDIWKSMWNPDQAGADVAGKIWPHMQAFLKELHLVGVTLLVGTDLLFPGIIAGFSVHEEMLLWQEAGIPPADVLRSATIVPARFLGLDNHLGTITESKTASLVLVRANPLEDVRNASRIEGVFLRGRYFDRAELDGLLHEAKELCRQE